MDLREKIEELFQTTPDYIYGVSFGFKTVEGKQTQDLAIIFHINQKLPLESIAENERIPEFITIDGKDYPTDVINDSQPKNFSCYNISETNPSIEILPHRQKHRPIKGGTVICATSNCGYSYEEFDVNKIKPFSLGTLGAIVVDNTTNTLVGLTAGHVLSKEITSPTFRNLQNPQPINTLYPQKLNIIDSDNQLTNLQSVDLYNQEVFQFNESSGIDVSSNDSIGVPKRYVPISGRFSNRADAGIFTLSKNTVSLTGSNVQLGLDGTLNMEFATTGEIYDIFTGQKTILSAGRTTGPKNSGCRLTIKNYFASIVISGYYENNILTGFGFSDLIGFGNNINSPDPAAAGDSGSILYADCNGENKIIGVVFAGSQSGSNNAYACRIDRIAERLNINPWTGNVLNFDNLSYKKALITGANQNSPSLIVDGETYFQAGIHSNFVGPVNPNNLLGSDTIINPDGTLTINPNLNPSNTTQNVLPDDLSNDDSLNIKDTDMFLSDFNVFPGSSAYSVIAEGRLVDSNFQPVSNATIVYKVEVLSTVETSEQVLRGTISTVSTDQEGVFTIVANNTAQDSLSFRVKVLDAVKDSYDFKPELSEKNEETLSASPVENSENPPTPPPSDGNEQESIGNNEDSQPTSTTSSGGGLSVTGSRGGIPSTGSNRWVECCDDPASIKNSFSAELSVGVYCKSSSNGVQTRIEILADLIIKNNPIVCEGNNLQAYLTIGGIRIKFRPWITFGTTRVSTESLILSQSQFDKILSAASGGLTPVRVIIHGSLNSATSVGCINKTLKYARVNFPVDTPIKYISWNENVTGSDQVQGPHCIGTQEATCSDNKCPAKCCDCCGQVVDTGIREFILSYRGQDGKLYFTKEPCPDSQNAGSRLYTDLFTCAFDCDCLEPEDPTQRVPIFTPTASKRSISCERSNQTCYQCVLVPDGCPPDSYNTSLFNTADILPLGTNLLSNHKSTIYKSV
jgi:hypothetical protein